MPSRRPLNQHMKNHISLNQHQWKPLLQQVPHIQRRPKLPDHNRHVRHLLQLPPLPLPQLVAGVHLLNNINVHLLTTHQQKRIVIQVGKPSNLLNMPTMIQEHMQMSTNIHQNNHHKLKHPSNTRNLLNHQYSHNHRHHPLSRHLRQMPKVQAGGLDWITSIS